VELSFGLDFVTFIYKYASLNEGTHSEKSIVRRFRRCAKVIECTYTNLDSIAHYTPRLYGIAYCT